MLKYKCTDINAALLQWQAKGKGTRKGKVIREK